MKSLLRIEEACKLLEEYLARQGLNPSCHDYIKEAFSEAYALHIVFVNGSEFSFPKGEY